jgi:hypothetical protein
VRKVLEPWLGRAGFDQSPVAPKLRFKAQAEDPNVTSAIKLKVEINTAETEAYDPKESRSKFPMRGSREQRQYRPFLARESWQRNSGRCCNVTKGAIFWIWRIPSTSSLTWTESG